ncbi:MAG: hypothetical protein LBC75_09510, partial [Fibromonadaceae bacterium]|nr:hypothetical protein [Fibromonadaceae bacterium]
TVVIGTQTWFQRNLNYDVAGSKCNENSTANCNEYGRLYNWRTAMVVCPSGWHLPSDAEWTVLVDFVGGTYTAGTKLKATSGWNFINEQGNGTDMYGFSALPGAYGNPGGGFSTVGYGGCWWSATTEYSPHYWQMYAGVSVIDNLSLNQDHLMSVRCIQD